MSPFIDMTGRRIGRLVVIGRAPNRGRFVTWRVRCDCGTKTIARGDHMRAGVSTSCGCWQREVARAQAIPDPLYGSVHSRLARLLGPAKEHTCPCGQPAKAWAYDHLDPDPHTGRTWDGGRRPITVAYSPDITHYTAMCRRCARYSDLGAKWAVHQPPPVHHHERSSR